MRSDPRGLVRRRNGAAQRRQGAAVDPARVRATWCACGCSRAGRTGRTLSRPVPRDAFWGHPVRSFGDQSHGFGPFAQSLAADPKVEKLAEHGNRTGENNSRNRPATGNSVFGSNSAAYIVRRLKRDNPAIRAGELLQQEPIEPVRLTRRRPVGYQMRRPAGCYQHHDGTDHNPLTWKRRG